MWSVYVTILICGFISGVYTETCPAEEAIYPCRCEDDRFGYIHVKCSSFLSTRMNYMEILRKALNSLTGKNNVDLRFENFNISIPSNLFSGIGIRDLRFHSCRMDSLTKDDQPGLLGLENHLDCINKTRWTAFFPTSFLFYTFAMIIHLLFAYFTDLNEEKKWLSIYDSSAALTKLNVGHLKKLRRIELGRNNIAELGDDWFSHGPFSLETLIIQDNNITKIGNNAFSQLRYLGTLYLNGNRLDRIKRSMFSANADRLKLLYLENNGLTDLPEDLFSRMPSIDYISLQRNGIMTLDERTWSPIWQQLSHVDLFNNKIFCDDRLNWVLKSKKKPVVFGQCNAPEEFEGMSLIEFFENRSR